MEMISTGDLAAMLATSTRRAQQVMAALEGLGFQIERDSFGGRRIPRPLALLVVQARERGEPLEGLLSMPEAAQYLRSHPAVALGEAVGEALYTLRQVRRALAALGASLPSWPPRWSWQELALEDPRQEGEA